MSTRRMSFPFRIAPDGRTTTPKSLDDHVREEVIQLLLTNLGERPFLPSFGGGLRRLVFERNDDVTSGITRAAASAALDRWLGHRVKVERLEVSRDDAKLIVDLVYKVIATDETKHLRFERQGDG